jgi:hypothetical protein
MQMQIRGSTQIKDLSIPLEKLEQDLQDRLTAATQRIDLLGTLGATFFIDARLDPAFSAKVYRGLLLSPHEYTITAGRIDFIDPLDDGEHVTVFLEGVAGGAAQDLAASPALDLPTQPATDLLLIVRSGTVYTAPLAALS